VKDIEKNHEAYANDGIVAASRQVRAAVRSSHKAARKGGAGKEAMVSVDE
jgi:hypothetical protein